MSKATFGEPLMHAIGHAYTAAAKKHIGYRESLLGIDGHLTSIGQKMRSNYMHLDVSGRKEAHLHRRDFVLFFVERISVVHGSSS